MHRQRHRQILSGRSAGSILAIATILAAGCSTDDGDATATVATEDATGRPSESSGDSTDPTADDSTAETTADATDPTLNPTSDTSDTRVVPCESPVDAEFVGSLAITNADDIANIQQYSSITGGVGISTEEITSLDFMACVTSIGGNLQVFGTAAEDLAGLGNLTTLGGSVAVSENLNLREVWGFEGLTEIGGAFVIQQNPVLTGIFGFDQVQQIGLGVAIDENPVLTDVAGFDALVAVGTDTSDQPNYPDLSMTYNPELLSIRGFVGIRALSGQLVVQANPKLCISEIKSLADMLQQWIQMGEGNTSGNNDDC